MPVLKNKVLVLGSGPNAGKPRDFGPDWSVATVNASQAAAMTMGIAVPDLTLFGVGILGGSAPNLEAQAVLGGLSTKSLVVISKFRHIPKIRWKLFRMNYRYSSFFHMSFSRRLEIINQVLHTDFDHEKKPSNGLFLALYCYAIGCRHIVMSGFSLTQAGHSYSKQSHERHHVREDEDILRMIKQMDLPIYTNSQKFSEESGLKFLD